MKKNKDGLDEMQRERRNKIGNQMFLLMSYALLIDTGLYGQGIRWLEYPGNIMTIFIACMGIYLVRLIANNAYLPAKAHNKKTVVALILAIVFSITLTITAITLFRNSAKQIVESTNNNSAWILFIISAVGLLVVLITAIIKKVSNKEDKEDR